MCGYPKPNTHCIEISVQSFMCAMKNMCKHSLVEPRTKVDAQHNMLAQAHASVKINVIAELLETQGF